MKRITLAVVPLVWAAAASAQVPTCSAPTTLGEPLMLTITSPLPGSSLTLTEPCCDAAITVTGNAAVGLPLFDFYFVIDSSGSTGACSGADIDGDGETGVPIGFNMCTDPDDSILAAEVRAVRDFVATLTPVTSRVAVIQFSNPEGFIGIGERQRIVQSLTDDFALVNLALDDVLAGGSAGATDYGGGLTLVNDELVSNGDLVNRRQFAYFMSDGIPTFPEFPFNSEEPLDSQTAIDVADNLGLVARIDTFGVGFIPSVTRDPVLPKRCLVGAVEVSTLECIAVRTGGEFFASNDPADIVDRLRMSLPPLGIESVTVFNDSLFVSVEATVAADGAWTADVPVGLGGVNLLRALALATDATPCEALTDSEVLCTDPIPLVPVPAPELNLPGRRSLLLGPDGPASPASPASPLSPSSPCEPASPSSPSSPTSPSSGFSTLRHR